MSPEGFNSTTNTVRSDVLVHFVWRSSVYCNSKKVGERFYHLAMYICIYVHTMAKHKFLVRVLCSCIVLWSIIKVCKYGMFPFGSCSFSRVNCDVLGNHIVCDCEWRLQNMENYGKWMCVDKVFRRKHFMTPCFSLASIWTDALAW